MKRKPWIAGSILLTLAALSARAEESSSAQPGGSAGVFAEETLEINGHARSYRLVVPKSVDLSRPAPLVFAFHGLGDSKDLMPVYSRLDALAEKEKFLLVYPNGRGRCWPLLKEWAKDDLAFFDALLAGLSAKYRVDARRVYATGMSNGAYFCQFLAAQRAEKIAAVAAHSGGLLNVGLGGTEPARKFPVLLIHGADDRIVPASEMERAKAYYTKHGHEVEAVEVAGLGHFWAHAAGINERIWKFFAAHPLKG
ncbi:MAG: phospholipase [Planctomycetota bacterium]|nr:phospholipase [Planctomycetota bacterium]